MKILRIFFIFFSIILFSQNVENFSVSTLSQDDGLSQGSNYFRFEDSHGFMWITGNDALNRYDGENVKVYNLKKYFENCPTLQQGYGITEDENSLYVGSTRGLYQYNYQKDIFTLIDFNKNSTLKNSSSKTIIPFGFFDGKVWCFNENYDVISYDTKSKILNLETKIPLEKIKSVHVYDNAGNVFYFRMPFFDKHNQICFTGKNKILLYNTKTKKIKEIPFNNGNEILCTSYVKSTDELFIGTKSNGILLFKNNYTSISSIKSKDKIIGCIGANENYIAYNTNRKFFLINRKNNQEIAMPQHNTTNNYTFDKIGRLWTCKDGFGEVILNFSGNFLKNSNDIQSTDFKFTAGVGYFSELSNNNVYIQSKAVFNTKKNTYKLLNYQDKKHYQDLYRKGIWSLDDFNNQNSDLIFMNENDKIPRKIININKTEFGILQDLKTFKNSSPLLSFSNGIFTLNEKEKKLVKVESLPDKNPFFINVLSNNKIAISYLNNDMILAEMLPNNQLKFIKKILPNVQSFYLQEDEKKHQFWAGTNEGVYLLDKNFKILKKFDSNNGLAGTYIYGILIDDFGKVWCSHQHGLSSIDTKTYQIINFDKSDGIQEWDFNNRAFLKASDGTLFFGGVNGFNYFKPPLKFNAFYKPEIYIDEILVNNKTYQNKQGFNTLRNLDLKNDENNISIKIFIKDLENSSKRNLFYRIKNHENIWKKISRKSPLTLNTLAPGKYEIEFGINDKFNTNIIHQKTLSIYIEKAFYQTFWFWTLVGGLFFGGIFGLYGRWRFLQQKNYYKQKLALENQRNKITADLHDDIGATLSSLQINSAIANKMIEKEQVSEAQKILKKIENQSQKLSENIGDIVWSLKPNKDALMTLSTRIRNSANEILGSSEIDYKIHIDKEIDQEFHDFSERKNVVLIVKEALNNIAKYSKAKEVLINFKKIEKDFVLEITDNGIGFTQNFSKGNGLLNMKKRAEEIGGKFEIISEKGTSIKITIPKIRD